MAKGKKSSGAHYTSKGQRQNVAKSSTKLVRQSRTASDRIMNQLDAWMKGKPTKNKFLQGVTYR